MKQTFNIYALTLKENKTNPTKQGERKRREGWWRERKKRRVGRDRNKIFYFSKIIDNGEKEKTHVPILFNRYPIIYVFITKHRVKTR